MCKRSLARWALWLKPGECRDPAGRSRILGDAGRERGWLCWYRHSPRCPRKPWLTASSCLLLLFSHSVVSNSCDPTDCSPPGFSVHGLSQARTLRWVAISFSRGSAWPSSLTQGSYIGRKILYHWAVSIAYHLPHSLQCLLEWMLLSSCYKYRNGSKSKKLASSHR